jgi:hypothetical protein
MLPSHYHQQRKKLVIFNLFSFSLLFVCMHGRMDLIVSNQLVTLDSELEIWHFVDVFSF